MIERFKKLGKASIIFLPTLFLLLAAVRGGYASDKVFTIGVVNSVPVLTQAFDGFKAGMAELGYREGEDVRYIYKGLLEDDQNVIDKEIRRLLSLDLDLLLAVGNETALQAKNAVTGSDMPVVVSSVHKPVESGIIKSMTHPGGNITGVAGLDRTAKTLEWMKIIIPDLKKILVPYNPDDQVSVVGLSELEKATTGMGIKLVYKKVYSVEETISVINKLPNDIKAMFMILSPTLNPRCSELVQAAIDKGLATGATLTMDEKILVVLAADQINIGKQTARLAHLIRLGEKPADTPFETSDIYLTINLKTAEKIGIHVPDDILIQAKTIIR